LALLGGALACQKREKVTHALLHPTPDMARSTIYFSYYTFEALAQLGRTDEMIRRMDLWFGHGGQGLTTLIESPEPSRSDCHAWGAHPVYHYFASILGVRPAGLGFAAVDITPRLGPLQWAEGTMAHPKGEIHARFERHGNRCRGEVRLPPGVAGTIHVNGETYRIDGAKTVIE
jgi:alpha-L-rhamnosidase